MKELNALINSQRWAWFSRIIYIRDRLRRGVGPWKV